MKTLAVFATAAILVVSNARLVEPDRRPHLERNNRKHWPSAAASSDDHIMEVHNVSEHGIENRHVLPLLRRWRVPDRRLRTLYHIRIHQDGTNNRRWLTRDKHRATHNMETSAADHSQRRLSGVNGAANPDSSTAKRDHKAVTGRSHAKVADVYGTADPRLNAHSSRSKAALDKECVCDGRKNSVDGEELDRRRRELTGGAQTVSPIAVDSSA